MSAFAAVFVARYRQFIRDRGALLFNIVLPIVVSLLLGWAFQNAETLTFKVGLADNGSPQTARLIAQGLDSVVVQDDLKVFETQNGTMAELLGSLRNGKLNAVIVVPEGVDNSWTQGQTADIWVYYDASLASNQQTLMPTLKQVIDAIGQRLVGTAPPIGIEEKMIQSHELRYIDFLLPGILGMTLMFIGVQGGLPIVQQRQAHIIKRLGCTPLRRSMLVLGDIVFRLIVVFLTAVLIILVGRLVFNVHIVGNWLSLCGIVVLAGLVFVSLGYLVASFVKTQESAVPILQIITLPQLFLSGTFFSVASRPIQFVVDSLPLTYINDALRQIMAAGTPMHSMSTDIAVMVGFLVVCFVVTVRFFQWD